MHERAAVNAAAAGLLEATGGRVREVFAVCGPGVDPEVARSIWLEAVDGTPAAAADLVFSPGLDLLRCLDCGIEYAGGKLDRCQACGGDGLVVAAAPEFEVHDWVGAD